MEKKGAQRHTILEHLEEHGGLKPGIARRIQEETGVPEADIYGVATFYSLIARPGAQVRVCDGLTCRMMGSEDRIAELEARGQAYERVSCLAQCDRAPVALDAELNLVSWGARGDVSPDSDALPINLGGEDDHAYDALAAARRLGGPAVIAQLKQAGLQGRGGAGFPAHFKWDAVARQPPGERYVVVNADEGEPGTFKDREIMLRRPHRLIEGMAIAAHAVGAKTAYIYIRGEFTRPRRELEAAIAQAEPHLGGLTINIVVGHGAYICGEETALLEAIEGRRGMPRLKPPYPTEQGLWGKPTLMNNVETLACVPEIVLRGGAWFAGLGVTEPGTKLYCISGHVQRPGTYELPLGATLADLLDAAGGPIGTLRAFSPGGASSGFLPLPQYAEVPLDFRGLVGHGTMLGSAGVVVLNDTVDLRQAVLWQQSFFEAESCGQCAPCRIGCSVQKQAIERFIQSGDPAALQHASAVAWEMDEGSICGLGWTASLPLTSAMKHFPEDFGQASGEARGRESE